MKKFRSKLDRLKEVKHLQERKLQQQLAQLLKKERWFALRLVSLQQEIERSQQQIIIARQEGDLVKQHTLREYHAQLYEAFAQIEKAIYALQTQRIELQHQLQSHHQKRKIIEKICQGHYNAWRRDMLKHDA